MVYSGSDVKIIQYYATNVPKKLFVVVILVEEKQELDVQLILTMDIIKH